MSLLDTNYLSWKTHTYMGFPGGVYSGFQAGGSSGDTAAVGAAGNGLGAC